MRPSPLLGFKTSLSPQKAPPAHLLWTPSPAPIRAGADLLAVSLDLPFLEMSYKWRCTIYVLASFIHHNAFWESPMLYKYNTSFLFIAKWHSIVWLHPILLICSPIDGHLLFLFPVFWLSWIMLLRTFVCKSSCGPMFSSLLGNYVGGVPGHFLWSLLV